MFICDGQTYVGSRWLLVPSVAIKVLLPDGIQWVRNVYFTHHAIHIPRWAELWVDRTNAITGYYETMVYEEKQPTLDMWGDILLSSLQPMAHCARILTTP